MLTRRVMFEMIAASAASMLAADKAFAYVKSFFAPPPPPAKTAFDEDFFRRQDPEVALELSQRWIDRARATLAEAKATGDYEHWFAVASSAATAEGHARGLFEIARLRARDSFKAGPQS